MANQGIGLKGAEACNVGAYFFLAAKGVFGGVRQIFNKGPKIGRNDPCPCFMHEGKYDDVKAKHCVRGRKLLGNKA